MASDRYVAETREQISARHGLPAAVPSMFHLALWHDMAMAVGREGSSMADELEGYIRRTEEEQKGE